MKKILLLATSALLLLAGCQKEVSGPNGEGGLQEVTFTANMAGEATRAAADNDGAAANVNRCIMEIYYGDDLFTRMYSTVADKKASFTTQLVANRTYTVAFWADCVASTSALATDQYYTTDGDNGLKAVSIKGTYAGNNDERDAFFHCGSYTVAQSGSTWSDIKLYRPFAQVNVITTDLQTIKPVPALVPSGVDVTVNNAYTTFNVIDGSVSAQSTLSYTGTLYNFPDEIGDKTEATLSMDYLFAASDKAVIDIDWKATKSNNADVSHAFANIPYQRNYRTNIKGALLTTSGKWNVTVDSDWSTPENVVVIVDAAKTTDVKSTLEASQTASPSATTLGVNVQEEAKAATGSERPIEIPASFTDYTSTPTAKVAETVINLEGGVAANETIVIRDEYDANNTTNITTYPGVILISATNATASNFDIQTPKATVYLNGTKIKDAVAQTAENTFVIDAGSEITGVLTVKKGNVDVYGKVNSIVRSSGNPDAKTVINLYDGAVWTNWESEKETDKITPVVNLGTYTFDPTGYNVAGSMVLPNPGSSPETWTVSVTEEWKHYVAESFSSIDKTNKVITIMNAAELAKFAKDIATLGDYSVILGADIDLSAHEWNPIASFNKTFDGNGRTISGMTVNGSLYQGLFASLNGADVLDLTISGADVTSTITSGEDSRCGVLAGQVSSGSITNVKVLDSDVTANGQYVGAIFGIGYSEVDGCEVSGCDITGTEQVGAALGYMWVGYIQNCTVTGNTVHATSQRAGGLIGKVQFASGNMGPSTMWIKNNTISGTVTAATENTVGGLAGQIMGDCDKYEISGNSIDAAGTDCPIGTLRASQPSAFTSVLAAKIHDNTWTEETYAGDSYTYPASLTGAGDQIIWNGSTPDPVAKIGETEYLTLDAALKAGITNNDGVPVKIIKDITYKPSATWTPVPIGFYLDTRTLVVDGGNHTITNLPDMLFEGHAGCFNLSISDLNFEKPTATDDEYAAVICGDGNTSGTFYFSKVTINRATVTSGDYAGAFIGYNATHGDGGSVTFTNCSVTNSTITGVGSTGALMGHATGNGIGKVTVTGTTVTGNAISCTESGKTNKAGSLFGTVGIAGENIYVSATVSGNTVTSDGTAITTIYGRKGSTGEGTGNLYLTEGGSYSDKPIADADASWAMCDDGCVLEQVDNVWTVLK